VTELLVDSGMLVDAGLDRAVAARCDFLFKTLTGVGANVPASYGLRLANLGGLLGHNGSCPATRPNMWHLPSSGATFVVLLNGSVIDSAGPQLVSDAMVVSMSQIVLPPGRHHHRGRRAATVASA
jgi:hypothetical protein